MEAIEPAGIRHELGSLGLEDLPDGPVGELWMSNRIQVRPLFAPKNDPSDGAKTSVAEPHVAEQSRSWRAVSGEQEVMRGS
jgi:hypothetical protein